MRLQRLLLITLSSAALWTGSSSVQGQSLFVDTTFTVQPLCPGDTTGQIGVSVTFNPANSGLYVPDQYPYRVQLIGPVVITQNIISGNTTVFNNVPAGSYFISASNSRAFPNNSVGGFGPVFIRDPDSVRSNSVITDVTCNGADDGSIEVFPSGGTTSGSGYTVTVNPGGLVQNANPSTLFSGLAPGTYTVEVDDDNSCPYDTTVTIVEPPVLMITGTPTDVTCVDSTNGEISYTITGGTPGYTFSFDNAGGPFTINPGNGSITGLAPGTYTLFAEDTNSCPANVPVVIGEPEPLAANPIITEPTCFGDADGVIVLNPTGGDGTYTADITPGGTTISTPPYSFGGLTAGSYDFHIEDGNMCPFDTTITMTEPDTLTLSGIVVDVTCFGFTDGSINVTVSGGTPFPAAAPNDYQYNFNGSGYIGATPSFTGLSAGVYTLQVRDVLGCTKDTSFVVDEPEPIFLNPEITNVSCNGENTGEIIINPTGGTGDYSVVFDGGAPQLVSSPSSLTFSSLPIGSYLINITDIPNGCTKDTTITIIENPPFDFGAVPTNPVCNGDLTGQISINPSGGAGTIDVYFDGAPIGSVPPGPIPTQTGLGAGTYEIVLEDDSLCRDTLLVTLTEPDSMTLNATVDTACFGVNNGGITLMVTGGTPGYNYAWTPASGGLPIITNQAPGSYDVTVTDFLGCTKDTTIVIPEYPEIFAGGFTDSLTCPGDMSGVIYLNPSGGSGTGFSFLIDLGAGPVAMTNPQGGLAGGNYDVTITDSRGCTKDTTYEVFEPQPFALNENITNVDCGGDATGEIGVAPTGGSGFIDVYFDGGFWGTFPPAIPDSTGLMAGTYQIVLEDDSLCRDTFDLTIIENPALTLTPTPTPPTCHDISDGSILVTISGGTLPYFAFIDGSGMQIAGTDTTFTGLNGDVTYQLVAQDINGCADTVDFFLDGPDTIRFNPIIDTACFASTDGGIDLNPTGGNGGFTYAWSPDGETTEDITGKAGNASYDVTITDALGCDEDTTIYIPEFPQIFPNESLLNSECYYVDTANVIVTPSGGSGGPYTVELLGSGIYAGPNPATPSPSHTFDPLEADGVFQLVTTDSYGCMDTTDVSTVSPGPAVPDLTICNVECDMDMTGSITVNGITGGTPNYLVSLDGGLQTAAPPYPVSYSGLGMGSYTIEIEDAVACTTDVSVAIEMEVEEAVIIPDTVTCPWSTDGELNFVTLTVNERDPANCPPTGRNFTYYYAVDDSTGISDPTISPVTWSVVNTAGVTTWVPQLAPGYHELYLVKWDDDNSRACSTWVDNSTYFDPLIEFGPYVEFPTFSAANPTNATTEWGYFQNIEEDFAPLDSFAAPYFVIFAPDTVTAQTSSTPANRDDANGIIWLYNLQYGVNWPGPGYTFSVDDTTQSNFVPFVLGNPLLNQVYDLSRGCYDFFVRDINQCLYGPFPVCVDGELFIPNIFTPNGDGINDFWEVTGLPDNSKLRVFNRWGNLVYENTNYQNNWSGSDISDGIYYYQLTMTDGREFKGWVEVVR